jgi:hypothetical protein
MNDEQTSFWRFWASGLPACSWDDRYALDDGLGMNRRAPRAFIIVLGVLLAVVITGIVLFTVAADHLSTNAQLNATAPPMYWWGIGLGVAGAVLIVSVTSFWPKPSKTKLNARRAEQSRQLLLTRSELSSAAPAPTTDPGSPRKPLSPPPSHTSKFFLSGWLPSHRAPFEDRPAKKVAKRLGLAWPLANGWYTYKAPTTPRFRQNVVFLTEDELVVGPQTRLPLAASRAVLQESTVLIQGVDPSRDVVLRMRPRDHPEIFVDWINSQSGVDPEELEVQRAAQLEARLAATRNDKSTARRREPIPQHVRREVWNRDGGRCVDCGSREKLEYDHIIPVSRGGSNTARNIELRCERCNRSKGARI